MKIVAFAFFACMFVALYSIELELNIFTLYLVKSNTSIWPQGLREHCEAWSSKIEWPIEFHNQFAKICSLRHKRDASLNKLWCRNQFYNITKKKLTPSGAWRAIFTPRGRRLPSLHVSPPHHLQLLFPHSHSYCSFAPPPPGDAGTCPANS